MPPIVCASVCASRRRAQDRRYLAIFRFLEFFDSNGSRFLRNCLRLASWTGAEVCLEPLDTDADELCCVEQMGVRLSDPT